MGSRADSPYFQSTYQVRLLQSLARVVHRANSFVSLEERPAALVRVCTTDIVPIHWTELNACNVP